MYLKSFSIQHVKCFEDLKLDFFRDGKPLKWNVILGENGTGKSTLLQAIAATLAGPEALKLLLPRPEGWLQTDKEQGALEATILSSKQDGPPGMAVPISVPLAFDKWSEPRPYLVHYVVAGDPFIKMGDVVYFGGPAIIVRQNDNDFNLLSGTLYNDKQREGWLACGYGPFRRLSGGSEQGREIVTSPSKAARYATLFLEGAALISCQEWLRELDYRAKDGDEPSIRRLEWAKQALEGDLLPEQTEVDISSKGVFFHSRGHSIPLTQLSDGYRSMLALSIDLLRWLTDAFPDSADPLQEQGIVLIDEIDAHLHPSWQRQIGTWLQEKFPNLQFIVTTHSPFIPQAAEEGGIITLNWAAGGKTVEARTDNASVQGWRVHQILTSGLFGLSTTLDPATERKMQRLGELEGKSTLSDAEQDELRQLRRELDALLPPPGETERERETFARLENMIQRAETLLDQGGQE